MPDEQCLHRGLMSAECEGYEDITEPLSIRVTCHDCHGHIDVAIEDIALMEWDYD
jgi:hypothetical protein